MSTVESLHPFVFFNDFYNPGLSGVLKKSSELEGFFFCILPLYSNYCTICTSIILDFQQKARICYAGHLGFCRRIGTDHDLPDL